MPVPARSDKAAGAASELGVEEEDDQSEVNSMDCEEEENEGGVEEGIEGGDPQENEDKKKATAATPPETAKKRKEGADAATAAGRDPSKKVKGTKKVQTRRKFRSRVPPRRDRKVRLRRTLRSRTRERTCFWRPAPFNLQVYVLSCSPQVQECFFKGVSSGELVVTISRSRPV